MAGSRHIPHPFAPTRVQFPEWQHEYNAALLEMDEEKVLQVVKDAKAAIHKRLEMLSESSESAAEREAIADALRMLKALSRRS